MKGLLIKDFIVITKQLKIILFVIPVMALVGTSMSAFSILLGAVLPMTAIAYDERSKWTELAAMMPYSKKDLIVGKYLLGYICMFAASVLVVIGQIIGQSLGSEPSADGINILLLSICGGLIFIAINTPVIFKFGSEKGRFVFIIAMALVGISGPILAELDTQFLISLSNISPLLLLCIAIVFNIVSIMISMKIKPKTH